MSKDELIKKYQIAISKCEDKMSNKVVKDAFELSVKISCYKSFIKDLQSMQKYCKNQTQKKKGVRMKKQFIEPKKNDAVN